ncbi:tripartite tricarboxylate transporter substrate binding protein [soil metagenome]
MTIDSKRRQISVAMAAALPVASLRAQGADYPKRPITLVVGFAAGGSNDIVARALAQPLGQLLGVSVVVEQRLGAAGVIATDHVVRSAPDGYTVLVTSASPLTLSPHTNANVGYDARKDLSAVTLLGITPETFAVHPAVPAYNLQEFIALAKKQDVTLASAGAGGLPHLSIELLRRAAPGTRIVHVPYNGATPAVTDTLAGHVTGTIVDLPAVYQHIKGGRLRGISMANAKRSEFLPDLATSGEQGLPDFVAVNWIGALAPAKTPAAITARLHAAILAVMQMESVKQALALAAVEIATNAKPADFQAFMADEYLKWGKVVKEAGVVAS